MSDPETSGADRQAERRLRTDAAFRAAMDEASARVDAIDRAHELDQAALRSAHQNRRSAARLVPRMGEFSTSDSVLYQSVHITEIGGPGTTPTTELVGPVDLLEAAIEQGATAPAVGVLLTLEQGWSSAGLTLGQLVHSLCLAPGEVTQIAIIDRRRDVRGLSEESIEEDEQSSKRAGRSRDIDHVTRSVTSELQTGSSMSASRSKEVDGGVGGIAGLLGFSSSGGSTSGVATQVNFSTGSKDVSASAVEQVQQATDQHAAALRSRQAVSIEEVSELQSEEFKTRVVANYNHMHALNMQYYEIVQVYELSTRVIAAERVIFLPMQVISFGNVEVLRYQRQLATAAFQAGLDDLAAAILARAGTASQESVAQQVEALRLKRLTEEMQVEQARLEEVQQAVAASATKRADLVWERDEPVAKRIASYHEAESEVDRLRRAARDRYWDVEVSKRSGTESTEHGKLMNSVRHFGALKHAVLGDIEGLASARKDGTGGLIRKVGPEYIRLRDSAVAQDKGVLAGLARLTKFESSYRADVSRHERLQQELRRVDDELAVRRNQLESAERRVAGLKAEVADQDRAQQALEQALAMTTQDIRVQLNERQLSFNQAIWQQMDASTACALVADLEHEGIPLGETVDPRPVAVTGNYVGFRWRFAEQETRPQAAAEPGGAVRPSKQEEFESTYLSKPGDAADGPAPGESAHERSPTLAIPTGGLFAEAVLGESNAAERVDLTRFWNWDDTTIPIRPTGIGALRSKPLDGAEAPTPGELAAPTIGVEAQPDWPDRPDLGAILKALRSPTFRDMSGSKNVAEMLRESMRLAAEGSASAAEGAQENFSAYMDYLEKALPVAIGAVATGGTSLSPTMIAGLLNATGAEGETDKADLLKLAAKAGLVL